MFLFPFIYTTFFGISLISVLKARVDKSLLFFIFGLPIYITTLSVTHMYGLGAFVPMMQWFKEIIILLAFTTVLFSMKKKPRLSRLDKIIILYFAYVVLYIFVPFGGVDFKEKLVALKSLAFFPIIYFTGRFTDITKINLNKYFRYICLVSFPAAVVVLWERVTYTHFQTLTGYADYMLHFYGQEPAGNHGLSWTFEAENDGPKRFASIFANPLDHAAGTLTIISAVLALITSETKKVLTNRFLVATFCCSAASIFFALSRASFASYFIIIYLYAYVTNRKAWLHTFHFLALIAVLIVLYFITGDFYEFIIATLNFTNSSSVYHILQWLEGIETIMLHPLGIGLGNSGAVAGMQGNNVGGESQLIIISVQCGLIALVLFITIYYHIVRNALRITRTSTGKLRRLAIFVLLLSSGMIIPFITAEAMSYVYVIYVLWFFAGMMSNMQDSPPDVLQNI